MNDDMDDDTEDGPETLSQIGVVAAICKYLGKCGIGGINHRQTNAIIEAANVVMDAINKPHQHAVPGSGLVAWLLSDDTGISSRAIARHLSRHAGMATPIPREKHWHGNDSHPRDRGDFGRCYRLLEAVPELRSHLAKMAELSPEWAGLVAVWDELESLYREELPSGNAPKLYARIKSIIDKPESVK